MNIIGLEPDTSSAVVDSRAFRTAFTDTLTMLLGAPSRPVTFGAMYHGDSSGDAQYTYKDDAITFNVNARRDWLNKTNTELRLTLAHEWWHMAQSRVGAEFAPTWSRVPKALPSTYAATNEREHQAEAFAMALVWLQTTRSPAIDAQAADTTLYLSEQFVPGTRLFVSYLLSHPLMADHPINIHSLKLHHPVEAIQPPWTWGTLPRPRVPAHLRLLNVIESTAYFPQVSQRAAHASRVASSRPLQERSAIDQEMLQLVKQIYQGRSLRVDNPPSIPPRF